eukprot:1176278-Prorocentrum_minimum.AAC.6
MVGANHLTRLPVPSGVCGRAAHLRHRARRRVRESEVLGGRGHLGLWPGNQAQYLNKGALGGQEGVRRGSGGSGGVVNCEASPGSPGDEAQIRKSEQKACRPVLSRAATGPR